QVQGLLEPVFRFTFDGPRLKVDRKSWESVPLPGARVGGLEQAHPLEGILWQIQSATGGGGGTTSVSGPSRNVQRSGTKLWGGLHTRGDHVRLVLEEQGGPQRTPEFHDDGKGGLLLLLTNPGGDLVLLRQSPTGTFAATALVGGRTFAGQGESFVAFFRKHRAEVEADILPVLGHFGIRPVPSPHTPGVRKAVLAPLLRTPESLAEGKKLLADLDNAKFEVR